MSEPNDNPTTSSEGFRNVPKAVEMFGNVPQSSETSRTVPNGSESSGNMPQPSERKARHTLTVREVARLFEAASVARTERSIVNWCQRDVLGTALLDSYYDPNDRKYSITPESVDSAIANEQAKAAQRGSGLESSGVLPNAADTAGQHTSSSAGDARRIKELEQEVLDLKITNKGKDDFIEQLRTDRERLTEERRESVERLLALTRTVG